MFGFVCVENASVCKIIHVRAQTLRYMHNGRAGDGWRECVVDREKEKKSEVSSAPQIREEQRDTARVCESPHSRWPLIQTKRSP